MIIKKYRIDKNSKSDNVAFEEFLEKPTKETINKLVSVPTYNIMHCIIGPTGIGKNKNVYDNLIPLLFKKTDVRYVQFTAPMTEVIEKNKLADVALDSGVHFCDNPEDALSALKRGKKVLACATNTLAWTDSSSSMIKLREYLLDKKNKFKDKIAIINDEIHTWLTSGALNYKKNNGNFGGDFSGTMYNLNEKFSDITPFIFGLTATPTKEQNNKLPVLGKLKFEIINDKVPVDNTFMKKAFIGDTLHYNVNDKKSTKKAFTMFIDEYTQINKSYKIKNSMLIQCNPSVAQGTRNKTDNVEWKASLPQMLSIFFEHCKKQKLNDVQFGIMTADGKRNYNINGNQISTGGNVLFGFDKDYKPILIEKFKSVESFTDTFDSQDNEAKFLFIIERGKCGMNIHGLKWIFSAKEYKTKKINDSHSQNYEIYTNTIEQLVGRGSRLNIPGGKSVLDSYNFNAIDYVQKNPDKVANFIAANMLNICCPDNDVWKVSNEKIKEGMIDWKEVEFDLSVMCPHCNGTGEISSTFNCDKKTSEVLDNILLN